MSLPERGMCPICGERIVRNLDHYMPKSIYKNLVVTTENLVPICRDCNFDKADFIISKPEDAPLHPYFDNVDNAIWLKVKLYQGVCITYEADPPDDWEHTLKQRVRNHFNRFSLNKYYSSKASQEVAEELDGWKRLFIESGELALKSHLEYRCDSIVQYRLNSWKSALYRGCVEQFDILLGWLI